MAHERSHDCTMELDSDGTRYWLLDGLLHRCEGPAVERPDGSLEWWRHGQLHNDNGPAVIRADGTLEWWKEGRQIVDK
jgi:hypothetical protein